MATGTIIGRGKPKGFRIIDEGEQVLHITEVEGKPRAAIKIVEMKMTDSEGVSLTGPSRKQTYNLENEGGYAAFYYLVLNGLGIDLDEGDAFDVSQLNDIYVVADIVHRDVTGSDGKTRTYSNISKVIGPAEPFDGNVADDEDEDDDNLGNTLDFD